MNSSSGESYPVRSVKETHLLGMPMQQYNDTEHPALVGNGLFLPFRSPDATLPSGEKNPF